VKRNRTDPAVLREDIERTREEVAETVALLAGRTGVHTRRAPLVLVAFGVLFLLLMLPRRRRR